jgi:SpoVK/Ycf46/Vps4 family AAA+-type ATPase
MMKQEPPESMRGEQVKPVELSDLCLAAEIERRLSGRELYAVELGAVVSKYIGETEKNLDRLFAAAAQAGAALIIDEAETLFGKRGEVQDAHDRYANIEVAYLLDSVEKHGGIAILATNMRQNVDSAFTRRLRFVIEFPPPQ